MGSTLPAYIFGSALTSIWTRWPCTPFLAVGRGRSPHKTRCPSRFQRSCVLASLTLPSGVFRPLGIKVRDRIASRKLTLTIGPIVLRSPPAA